MRTHNLTEEEIDLIFYPNEAELEQLHKEQTWDLVWDTEPTPDELRKAIKDAEQHTDGFYIAGIVHLVLKNLTKAQMLHLLICAELGKDFRRLLPFADWVEILFTEDTSIGEATGMHLYTKLAMRGYISVKLCLW